MTWIFFSPHYDDAVYSCGGLIWELAHRGQRVEIWTVCGGSPAAQDTRLSPFASELHKRWQGGTDPIQQRAAEDRQACLRLSAIYRHLPIPDCIYRFLPSGDHAGRIPLIQGNNDLFDLKLKPEAELVEHLLGLVREGLPADSRLVSPLAIGNHIDHRLTREAAEKFWEQNGMEPLYYADVPYVMDLVDQIPTLAGMELHPYPAEISPQGLLAWQDAALAYTSQMSSFWENEADLRRAFSMYREKGGGVLFGYKGG